MVSNKLGEACRRCSEMGLQCNKQGRSLHGNDACSERCWFGGRERTCVIAANSSYNDSLWRVMMSRGSHNHTLPAHKDKQERAKRPDALSHAMLSDSLVQGWTGLSFQQVADAAPAIPQFVRDLPRAYLVAPRLSATHSSSNLAASDPGKRKRDDENEERREHEARLYSPASGERYLAWQPSHYSPSDKEQYTRQRVTPMPQENHATWQRSSYQEMHESRATWQVPVHPAQIGSRNVWDAHVPRAPASIRPAPHPGWGELLTSSYSCADKQWTHVYESGTVLKDLQR